MNPFRALLEIVYPPRCAVCGAFLEQGGETDARDFCPVCLGEFKPIAAPLCPVCGRPFVSRAGEDHPCEECMSARPLYDMLRAPFLYEGALMEAIHQFKYGQKMHLGRSLGRLTAQFAGEWLGAESSLMMMPVPLHPRRLRKRGFNQSLVLARHAARRIHAGLDYLSLRRVRHTEPQTGLGKEERSRNMRKAFALARPGAVEGRHVVLVDDVATTGSTLNECARVLKRAGCKSVRCLVLARAVEKAQS
jgi:ComF family protein